MRARPLPAVLLVAFIGAARADTAASLSRDLWLERRVDEARAAFAGHPELAGARVGIALVDAATGRALVRRDADRGFNAASNVKIVTGAAALAVLGPEYTFKTTLLGRRAGELVAGDLYLRAGADPTLDAAALWELVQALRRQGVRRIAGSLVIDEGWFDAETLPPAFGQKSEDAGYRASVSAASLHYNAVTVRVLPGPRAGAPAVVSLWPPQDYVAVHDQAVTAAGRGPTAIAIVARVSADGERTEVVVTGSIRLDDAHGVEERKRVEHPARFFAAALRATLAAAGLGVAGVRFGAAPPGTPALAVRESAPLAIILRDMEKWSNNFMAETVLKAMGAETGGAPGTWAKGTAAVRAWLAGIGVPEGSYRYDNGSGLYDSNRFSPDQLTQVLRAAWIDFRLGPDLAGALALGGAEGTLARRLRGGSGERYVRAKTGTQNGTSALSGYAGATSGRVVCFSVLINDLPDTPEATAAARALQDEVAEAAAAYFDE
jgi:serine-type D-Ala-D-Ala carboxypeptidase/endopeptidase (penicillin-binding protein 4)